MITDILRQQLADLLGNLSLYYSSGNILNSIKLQINSLKGKVSDELINTYQKDFNILENEYKKLDDNVNDIISNSSKIQDLINKVSNFSWTMEYFKSVYENDYSLIEKYAKIVPQTIKDINIFNENLQTLQLAIINQTGQYSLKSPMSTKTKILIISVMGLIAFGVYKYA